MRSDGPKPFLPGSVSFRGPDRPARGSSAHVSRVRVTGHLLDSGLFSQLLDSIAAGGGSWDIVRFAAGQHHEDQSRAEIDVFAASRASLEAILASLAREGCVIDPDSDPPAGSKEPEVPMGNDALVAVVEKDGVAPETFVITTIYPTEVQVGGAWIRVERQRMDAAIALGTDAEGKTTAACRLIRDLRRGDRVVCGSDGLRVHEPRTTDSARTFKFMGSGVSSERRVEVAVDQIAYELQAIRRRGGRTVVVAGPVVVHTGGAPHLATMIRNGYVTVLLGGNAVAVHDIEHSMFGTSLGVDLQRGQVVPGGHKHHIRTINMVRGCGGIREAVDAGKITGGIMFECIKAGIPFSLAGSIRDDGPLPETEMDLVKAQEECQRLILGADMILMLSSMLHSIGVGNMTPAGVKLICVDINPSVVTKLTDRGSQESVGVVTDVGLFLNLLARRLRNDPPSVPDIFANQSAAANTEKPLRERTP